MDKERNMQDKKWWHGAIAYQIYPRSFQDSNGDGIGDIRGIISRLGYLKDLGVDIIWLSPVYPSPQVDNGYDISDYRAIGPEFGTMEDFRELLSSVHRMGMKLIMDLVVNHCSSEHPLFKRALADPFGEDGRCFYFVKGRGDGAPPDNLRSYFGGSVWEKVEGQDDLWYLHYFAKEQPDLNWSNPRLREKVYSMMNWWLDLGIDGFRVDAIMNIAKDPSWPGLPPDEEGDGMCSCSRMTAALASKAPPLLKEMRDRTYGPRGAFTVGEAFGLNPSILLDIYGPDGAFSSVFDFTVREMFEKKPGYYAYEKPTVRLYRDGNFKGQELSMATGMASVITENHDEPRALSFFLREGLQNAQGAKALAKEYKSYVIKIDPDVPSSNTAFSDMLHSFGFQSKEGGKNFEAIQPKYVFRLNVEGKTEEEILAGFHQKW
ncbi:MAG: alpha-amylase family glycosyl hydrolase, partial [Succinivibrio sp.]